MDTLDLSLYLHIPFCTEKCDYCDFYSVPINSLGSSAEQDLFLTRYAEALLFETERRLKETVSENRMPVFVPSLYIGGGTPSLLGEKRIVRLLECLKNIVGIPEEITIEANPETTVPSFLQSCADHGVTRLSLGIQSFNKTVLKAAGRQGYLLSCTNEQEDNIAIDNLLNNAKTIFGQGLSLDLMSGLPGQNKNILLKDIEKALSYEPGHISLYALTVEEGTPLALRSKNNKTGKDQNKKITLKENSDDLWLSGRDALKKAGYEHYEISNFARSSACRSIHNIRYWRMNNWLGIGPAASGTIINSNGTGRRISYSTDIDKFINAVQNNDCPPVVIEDLERNTLLKETLLMGFRYCEGPDPVLFVQRLGKTIEEVIPRTLFKWQKKIGTQSIQETIMNYLNLFLLDAFMELEKNN